MKLTALRNYTWGDEEIWSEKWYNTEIELLDFGKKANPLRNLFTSNGLRTVALNATWYFDRNDIQRWYNDENQAISLGLPILKKVVEASENYIEEIKQIISDTKEPKEINHTDFLRIKWGFILCWRIFDADLGRPLTAYIDALLEERKLTEKESEAVKNYCFIFKHPFGFQKEEAELKKIRTQYEKKYGNKKITYGLLELALKESLIGHTKKFAYLTGLTIDTKRYTEIDFFEKLQTFNFHKQRKQNTLPQTVVSKLHTKDRVYLRYIHRHIFIDNYAADLVAKLMDILEEYLAKNYGISRNESMYYTMTEIEDLIKIGKRLSGKDLATRKQWRVMIALNNHVTCYYGKRNYKRIEKLIHPLKHTQVVSELKGMPASIGIVRGIVKIVNNSSDMIKMNKGDILVSHTTHPDLMQAIVKAGAIVTDYGGITSHAAIISREFHIPCIVATGHATDILKDGDLVEVNAKEGVVQILQSL